MPLPFSEDSISLLYGDEIPNDLIPPPDINGDSTTINDVIVTGKIPSATTVNYEVIRNPPLVSFGNFSTGSWTPVSGDTLLSFGDIVRFNYEVSNGLLANFWINNINTKIQSDPRFILRASAYSPEESTYWVEVKVIGAMGNSPMTFAAVAAIIVSLAVPLMIWLYFRGAERLETTQRGINPSTGKALPPNTSPGTGIGQLGTGLGLVAVAALIIYVMATAK